MINNETKPNQNLSTIKEIVSEILSIRNIKQLCLSYGDNQEFQLLIHNEKFLNSFDQRFLLMYHLNKAMESGLGGVLLIHEFLPIKVQRFDEDGNPIWINKQKVYGIQLLPDKTYCKLYANMIKSAYNYDPKTGYPTKPNPDIMFETLKTV